MLGQRKGDAVLELILFIFFRLSQMYGFSMKGTLSEVHYEKKYYYMATYIYQVVGLSETCGLRGIIYQYLIFNCRDPTPFFQDLTLYLPACSSSLTLYFFPSTTEISSAGTP